MTVSLPPLDVILNRWPQIEAHLRKATERTGCYEPIDLLQMAFAGRVGIWICEGAAMGWGGNRIDAVMVTEVKQFPRKRILEIMFAGGTNMKEWLPELRAAIDSHARDMGCAHIASLCRPGWIRAWGGHPTGDIVVVRGLGDTSA